MTQLPARPAARRHTALVRSFRLPALLATCGLLAAAPLVPAAAATLPAASAAAPAAAHPDAPLAEAEVRAFMTRIENAARARDLERLAASLAADCRVELRTRIDGHEQLTLLTRTQYLELLESGYAAFRDLKQYDYELGDVRVTLAPDGAAATVVSHVTETLVFQGSRTVAESVETSRIERRGGELKLVAVSALTLGR